MYYARRNMSNFLEIAFICGVFLEQEAVGILDRKLACMAQKVDMMCEKMDDMASASNVMNRGIHNSEKTITEVE